MIDDEVAGPFVVSGGPFASDRTYDIEHCIQAGPHVFEMLDWSEDGLHEQ